MSQHREFKFCKENFKKSWISESYFLDFLCLQNTLINIIISGSYAFNQSCELHNVFWGSFVFGFLWALFMPPLLAWCQHFRYKLCLTVLEVRCKILALIWKLMHWIREWRLYVYTSPCTFKKKVKLDLLIPKFPVV